MENHRQQEDWYRQSENRRPQGRYQHISHSGRPFPDQGPDTYQRQSRYSSPVEQGRGQDLHASHPYDYSLPPETNRYMSSGYFPPPAYRNRPDRNTTPQDRYDYPAPYQDRLRQDRWPDGRQPSYEERQDYIRDRDRHGYHQQHWDYQNRLHPQERNEFLQDNRFPPHYPSRQRDGYGWDGRSWNRSRDEDWPGKPQQNRNQDQQPRHLPTRPGKQFRY
jgi:hypothetical protein